MKPSRERPQPGGGFGHGQRGVGLRRRAAFALFLALVPLLASCTLPSPLSRTRTFAIKARATNLDTWASWEQHFSTNWLGTCGLNVVGRRSSSPVPLGQVYVGFEHHYQPGTNPFPCSYKSDEVFRATVVFDLSEIRKLPRKFVKHADFNYTVMSSDVCTASGRCSTNTAPCVTQTLTAEVSPRTYTGKLPPGEERALPTRGDVTQVVRGWVAGTEPNYGFVLRGKDETFPENNAACLSTLTNFVLTVDVLVPAAV